LGEEGFPLLGERGLTAKTFRVDSGKRNAFSLSSAREKRRHGQFGKRTDECTWPKKHRAVRRGKHKGAASPNDQEKKGRQGQLTRRKGKKFIQLRKEKRKEQMLVSWGAWRETSESPALGKREKKKSCTVERGSHRVREKTKAIGCRKEKGSNTRGGEYFPQRKKEERKSEKRTQKKKKKKEKKEKKKEEEKKKKERRKKLKGAGKRSLDSKRESRQNAPRTRENSGKKEAGVIDRKRKRGGVSGRRKEERRTRSLSWEGGRSLSPL